VAQGRDSLTRPDGESQGPAMCVEGLEEVDLLAINVYTRCTLNPGGVLDRLAGASDKAIETSSAGAIWFTRCGRRNVVV
jgi:hypothetical protein